MSCFGCLELKASQKKRSLLPSRRRNRRLALTSAMLTAAPIPVLRKTYTFSTAGITNFVVPVNVGTLTISAGGAGGGGGAAGVCSSATSSQAGSGGGGGGAAGSVVTVDLGGSLISQLVFNIGAGGAGGVSGTTANSGQIGGTTYVFVGTNTIPVLTAVGGGGGLAGGASSTAGGLGGGGGAGMAPGGGGGGGASSQSVGQGGLAGSNTSFYSPAQNGSSGTTTLGGSGGQGSGNSTSVVAATTTGGTGGSGGGSTGGSGGSVTTLDGANGTFGGGGGGGTSGGNCSAGNGGNGGPGVVTVTLTLQVSSAVTTSITPSQGPSGTTLALIKGSNFTTVYRVLFGTVAAFFKIQSDSLIVVAVPAGLEQGSYVITAISTDGISLSSGTVSFLVVASGPSAPSCSRQGTAAIFGLLANSLFTNTGVTFLNGCVGASTGTVVGFPQAYLISPASLHVQDSIAIQAQVDATTFYNNLVTQTPTQTITQDLGGLTLTPGVYNLGTTGSLNGVLTLNFNGSSASSYTFQVSTSFVISNNSQIVVVNGNTTAPGCNIFWQVGTSLTIGEAVAAVGSFAVSGNVSAGDGFTINGRLFSINGSITVGSSAISIPQCNCSS